MAYRELNMENYPRRDHFEYFRTMANPWTGLTVDVDVTELMRKREEERWPIFLLVDYAVARAANAVPEFRRRIVGESIVEYDHCSTSHTEMRGDGSYGYCTLDDTDKTFAQYVPYAKARQEKVRLSTGLTEEGDMRSYLYISCTPWVAFTHVIQPTPGQADSNPRIVWGKVFTREGRQYLPINVLVHHAIVDGLHIATFFENLDREFAALCE